jgi:hypothetical protein
VGGEPYRALSVVSCLHLELLLQQWDGLPIAGGVYVAHVCALVPVLEALLVCKLRRHSLHMGGGAGGRGHATLLGCGALSAWAAQNRR